MVAITTFIRKHLTKFKLRYPFCFVGLIVLLTVVPKVWLATTPTAERSTTVKPTFANQPLRNQHLVAKALGESSYHKEQVKPNVNIAKECYSVFTV